MRMISVCQLSLLSIVVTTALARVSHANDDLKIAAEVIAITKAQWAADIAGKPVPEQMASVASDYTEFNANFAVRVDTQALNVKLDEAFTRDGAKQLALEMSNPRVQVYGDTAILSYSFLGLSQAKDGKVRPSSGKSTRVYAKLGGQWKLVHAHFSTVAAPKD
jgi:ketosteroid isomerase-like protein